MTSVIPPTYKGPNSVAPVEDSAAAFQSERYTLVFDFETKGQ